MAQSGTVTLLFSDLVDSTAHLQEVGDEAGARLFQAHHKLLSDAISAAGGEELEWLGDGVLAAFSSTAEAVRCAINIQQSSRQPHEGRRFEIRIGIHLGEVLRREGGYFGTAVVIARRLCDRASSGQILCSRMIADILSARQAFSFRDLGTVKLKGIEAEVSVCEVLYERVDPAAMLTRTPFVGRSAQLERLTLVLQNVSSGRGSIVMLRGEPGIGKTRLLEEFIDLAKQRGAVTLHGACYDNEAQAPYGPFADAIEEYARAAPARFASLVGKRASSITRIAPSLHDSLGSVPELAAADKDEERFRLFNAVSQLFADIAREAPLALVLDDLHWADRGTVSMLAHVARNILNSSILLIGAYRDAEIDRRHPLASALASLGRLPRFESVALKGLAHGDLALMLEMVGDQCVPDSLVGALEDATGGNPLFVREVLLHLLEEGKLLGESKAWANGLTVEALDIPEGVRQVIDLRLQRLSEDTNELLKVSSAFNGPFSIDVAGAVAGLDENAALNAIDAALEAQIVRAGVNHETFDFTHALIRNTLYASLNSARRVRLHRKIAVEMERVWGEKATQHAAEVAYQFWRGAAAQGAERGAIYAIAAADHAEAAFDHYDVASFLRIALDLVAENDPRRPRLLARLSFAQTWALNAEEALKSAHEAGLGIAAAEGSPAAFEFYERIARAMFAAGLTRGAWQLASEGLRHAQGQRNLTWASLAEIDLNRAQGESASNPGILLDTQETRTVRDIFRAAPREELAAHNLDPILLSRQEILDEPSPRPRGLWRGGNLRLALSKHQEDAAECERRGATVRAMAAWAGVAKCRIALGDFVEGRAALDRASAMSTGLPTFGAMTVAGVRIEHHISINENWDQLVVDVRRDLGLPDDKIEIIDFLKARGPEALELGVSRAYTACIHAFMDERERATRDVSELLPALEGGAGWAFSYVPMALFTARSIWLLNSGQHAEAIERNIRDKVLTADFRWPSADCRLELAHLCALQARFDQAAEWFAKARIVLDDQGARPLRAMTDYDEALMYQRRGASGDRNRARPLFTAASKQFQALGMKGWLRLAEQASAARE